MAKLDEIINDTPELNYDPETAMSERFQQAQKSVDWGNHPLFNLADADKVSNEPVNRVYGAEDLENITSGVGTIAWDAFRKGVLDLSSVGSKAQMALGNTLAGVSGDRVGTEMRNRAADQLMKTMEDSRFIDSNYGDAETWTERFIGGAMSMGEMLAVGALTGPVGLGAYVGTLSLSDGALNDMVKYQEENGTLDGYETDPINLALDYGNAVFQVASELMLGTGRLVNGKFLKAGKTASAIAKETLDNFIQESAQGAVADLTEVLKGNKDISVLSENVAGYIKDGVVAGVLGGAIGGSAYKLNKNRALAGLDKINKQLHPEMTDVQIRKESEDIFEKTEEKMEKSFIPELVARQEATNDKGKIRENVRQKVEMMYRDNEDMTEKQKAKAIETTTTLELENMLYDSIEKKIPLTAHPLLQGEVNELGWFRDGIPENRRAEINALNDEIRELKNQRTQAMEAKDYTKLDELDTKIEEFRKNLPEKIKDLVVADREEIKNMLEEQRKAVENSQAKKQLFQKVKQMARKAAEKQQKADVKLAEQMATGAEKARAKREQAETALQTKEAKIRTLTEQRQIASSIKRLKNKVESAKTEKQREFNYAVEQATDESLRQALLNRDWNEYTVKHMKRRQLKREVKALKNISAAELTPMTTREITTEQERAETKQEKAKTAKGFFHRKINRDFANESGILQAWGYSKDDSAVNLVFVKDGGYKDWDEIVMALQESGYLPETYADTYEKTDALVDQAKDIVLNNKDLTIETAEQAQIDYTEDVGYKMLKDSGLSDADIQGMSYQQMSDKLTELYREQQPQIEEPEINPDEIPDIMWQDKEPTDKKELVVTHGTTLSKLKEALDLGAMPVPSLAVSKAEHVNKQYGEITFVGGKYILNKEPVYTSDIYSARRVKPYLVINDKGMKYLKSLVGGRASFLEANIPDLFGTGSGDDLLMHLYLLEKGKRNDPENTLTRQGADFSDEFGKMSDAEQKEYAQWTVDFEKNYFDKKIWAGYTPSGRKKTLDYNLENIVKLMAKKPTAGSEAGFGTSPHALKGVWAKPLKTIEAIRKNKNRLVSEEEYKKVDTEFWDAINKLTDLLRTDYLVKNLPYSYDEHIIATLMEIKDTTNIKALLQQNNMNDSDEAVQAVKDFKTFVESVPTKYFEAKPKRAVNFNEFNGVVMPTNSDYDEVAKRLADMGLHVERTDNVQEGIQNIDKQTPVLFQSKATDTTGKGKQFRGAYIPEYRFIAMTENMDASTLAHELAHDWGQEYFRWARSGKASESFMKSWGAVEKAMGITDKDTYFTYDASEKFARAYEGWLMERKDWADILHIDNDEEKKAVEDAMEDYRKELVDIYDSLTNPYFTMAWGKVGELKPELKQWFERSTKFESLDEQVRRGEITAEQASEEKLKDMMETATNNTVQNMSAEDKQAVRTIENLEKLETQTKETANRFDTEGGNRNAIQARLNQIALAKDLTANDAILERYDTHRDMLEVAKAADEFVRTRQEDAIKIINGEMAEQDGLYASDLYTALERVAKQTGDFELIDELRHSRVATELAKELGQRVAGFRNYTGDGDLDIVSALKKVDKIYDKAYNETEKDNLSADLKAWAEDLQATDSLSDAKLDEFFKDMECQ